MLWEYIKSEMQKHPDSTVKENDRIMSYLDVIDYAENNAKRLCGTSYGILCDSEMNTALSLLSCLAAGKTAILMSKRYGESHTNKILEKIKPEYLITDPSESIEITLINEPISFEDESPAMIMCTSGTGGTPKGVMISEKNLYTNIRDIRSYLHLKESDTVLIARPLYHCAVTTNDLFTSLVSGANIVFYSEVYNTERIIKRLIDEGATVLSGTPTTLSLMALLIKGRENKLHKITVSGECMTEYAARTIRKGFPDALIYHVYGQTEASPRISHLHPRDFDPYFDSVGFLLPSLKGIIVDDDGDVLLSGEVGELLIKGDSVMMGYYNDEAATKRVLTDGWLHTGDLAFIDVNGKITIKGRKDDLIIYAGMNIYPAEIENALKTDDRVKEVLAYGIKDDRFGQKIGVKIVGDFRDKTEIERLCVSSLAPYMRPTVIEWLDSLPKNGSGKIIRN